MVPQEKNHLGMLTVEQLVHTVAHACSLQAHHPLPASSTPSVPAGVFWKAAFSYTSQDA